MKRKVDKLLVFVSAITLDLAISEPPATFHPTVWFGKVAGFVDRKYRKRGKIDFLAGFVTSLAVIFLALFLAAIPEFAGYEVLKYLLEVYLLKTTFSVRSLYVHVKDAVTPDIDERRRAVGKIVSRDVSGLDEAHVNSAAIESLAENTVDAVIAPIFFYMLFGLKGAMIYRAVNTLDSMIGYRDEEHEYFGKFAARLDDVLNYIPSRLSLFLFLPLNPAKVFRYFLSARYKINSDKPVACMSAAIGVELEKIGVYRFEGKKAEIEDIERALNVYKIIVLEWVVICLAALFIRQPEKLLYSILSEFF